MDTNYPYKPEIGRGCLFDNSQSECSAKPCEGCFKLHETPWLEDYPDNVPTDIFEVRFKNTRRSYYQNVNNLPLKRGDIVAVEAAPGHDIGIVSLTGDMVARQMRRVGFNPYNGEFKKIYRKAKPYDIERWQEAIALEHETMILSRQIAADMGLNMKIGDVEYQGDKIKAIFYYIADERVDFRELIKVFAERFHIRIEMKQIGARQEAGRIGGLGACGRELCCASWISNFSSVTTGSARMQELSLNPQKLAGQCSKLKCCLMYEYDAYADARREMPRLREPLQTADGEYYLVKSDILSHTMSFSSSKDSIANLVTLPVSRVKEILAFNRAGKRADSLVDEAQLPEVDEPTYRSEEDSITRFDSKRRNNRRNRKGALKRTEGRTQQERTDRAEKPERSERAEKQSERVEKPERNDRTEKQPQERVERAEKQERGERSDRTEKQPQAPRGEGRPQQERSERRNNNRRRNNGGNNSGANNGNNGVDGSRGDTNGGGANGSNSAAGSSANGAAAAEGTRQQPRNNRGRNRSRGNRPGGEERGGNGENGGREGAPKPTAEPKA